MQCNSSSSRSSRSTGNSTSSSLGSTWHGNTTVQTLKVRKELPGMAITKIMGKEGGVRGSQRIYGGSVAKR